MFLTYYCGEALGNLVGALCRDSETAVLFGPVVLTVFFLVCGESLVVHVNRRFVTVTLMTCSPPTGFFVSLETLPSFISWLSSISILRYAFGGAMVNELKGLQLSCSAEEVASGRCSFPDGDSLLRLYGFQDASIAVYAGVLVAFFFAFHAMAAGVLQWKDWSRRRACT